MTHALAAALACLLVGPAAALQGAVPPARHWLKLYPLRGYGAHWRLELEVHDAAANKATARELFERYGGKSALPPDSTPDGRTSGHAQLSYRISRASADKALRRFRVLGKLVTLVQNENAAPELVAEARAKLEALRADRERGREGLQKLEALRGLGDELVEELERFLSAYEASEDLVLFNVELRERPAPKK